MITAEQRTAERKRLWLSFLLPFLTAFFLFLPFIVIGKGFFTYCGDFNSQQIPFYTYCQNFIKTGGGAFSWETDLGSGFMNTYSFYNLGSPFFWLTMLLPNKWLAYSMAPLLMLKFGVGGLGAYLFLRRYTKNRQWALLGAVLYCFSGWGIYDIFFNHFIDCLALFPYLLWSLDEFVYEKRRGLFPLFVAINLLNNYFFFIGEALFLCIWFFVKLATKDYQITLREFFRLAFETIVGCLLGCLLVFPAAASLMQNPRTSSFSNGYNLLLYGKVQQYFAILTSMFLPPDPPYLPNLFKDSTIKWTSMSLYLPMIGAAGVIAYLRARRRSPHRKVLLISLFMALVPILNSSFYAFNSSYYARWYYMPLLIMALCTINALEFADIDLTAGFKPVVTVLAALAVFGLVPTLKDGNWQIGVLDEPAQFWLIFLLAVLGITVASVLIAARKTQRQLLSLLLATTMGFSVIYGVVHISLGKFPQWEGDYNYKAQCYDAMGTVNLPDDHFYRTDTFESYDNLGLFFNMPCIRSFNSTVTPSILEFYPSVGVKRDVSSKPDLDKYALRGLLSVEYLLTPLDHKEELVDKEPTTGFAFDHEDGEYAVFRNQYAVPMGFTYDYYLLPEDIEDVSEESLGHLLLRAMLLTEEQAAQYGHTMTRLPKNELSRTSFSAYMQDCADRTAAACDEFTATRDGFTASIRLDSEKLVFFSVPYDPGFRATVNGQKAEVLKVDNGLIAIPAGAGENEIELVLVPQWLRLSQALTLLGIVVYLGYLVWLRRHKEPATSLLPLELRGYCPTVEEVDVFCEAQGVCDEEALSEDDTTEDK